MGNYPQRIVSPSTAFSTLRPRKPRQHKGDHLRFMRSLPCVICGVRKNVQAAHIRMASLPHGKRPTGIGEKSSDGFVTPLCSTHHEEQHGEGERAFWQRHKINPFDVAARLYTHSGDQDAAELVILYARERQ